MLLLIALIATCFVNTLGVEFIDNVTRIVRRSPSPDDGGLFGYSAVLHKLEVDGGLDSSRVIVGAPQSSQNSVNGIPLKTGALYSCSLVTDDCQLLGVDGNSSIYVYNDVNDTDAFVNVRGQRLGMSLFSNGQHLVVCAPRLEVDDTDTQIDELAMRLNINGFDDIITNFENMPGRCFITDRKLETFREYNYCLENNGIVDNTGFAGFRFPGEIIETLTQCNLGASIAGTASGVDTSTIVLGLPTSYEGRGIFLQLVLNSSGSVVQEVGSRQTTVILNNQITTPERCDSLLANNGHDGYAVAVGRITNQPGIDIISSQLNYRKSGGIVLGLVVVASTIDDASGCAPFKYIANFSGNQFGDRFGFSLLAIDLTGDGFDEVLIGAPLHYPSDECRDCGRIFVYSNVNEGEINFSKHLDGTIPFGRFGYAMASVGDINLDGCNDFVTSAPLSRDNGQSGTIYLFLGAGPDLLVSDKPTQVIVGSELSGLSSITSFGIFLNSGVDIDQNGFNDLVVGAGFDETVVVLRTRPIYQVSYNISASTSIVSVENVSCNLNGTFYPCFDVSITINHLEKSLVKPYNISYVVEADVGDGVDIPRLFFDEPNKPSSISGVVTQTAALSVGIQRRVYVKYKETTPRNYTLMFNVSLPDVNETIVESLRPTLLPSSDSSNMLTLDITDALDCLPDLSCSSDIVLEVSDITYFTTTIDIQEKTEALLAGSTKFVDVSINITINGDDSNCIVLRILPGSGTMFDKTFNQDVVCSTSTSNTSCATSLLDSNVQMKFRFSVTKTSGLISSIPILITSTSGCAKRNLSSTSDTLTVNIPVIAKADISISSEDLALDYNMVYVNKQITTASDLGPAFTLEFAIDSAGPTTVPEVTFKLSWPLFAISDRFYLYPTQFRVITSTAHKCNLSNFENPSNFTSTTRRRRQAQLMDDLVFNTEIRNCTGDDASSCTDVVCLFSNFSSADTATITIKGFLDERTLNNLEDQSDWTFEAFATVSINNNSVLRFFQGDNDGPDYTTPQITARPVIVATDTPPQESDEIEIWIIIVAIVAALIFLLLLVIVLYLCGCCRRKKQPEEEPEDTEQWVAPGADEASSSPENEKSALPPSNDNANEDNKSIADPVDEVNVETTL